MSSAKTQTILVIGEEGFLGQHIVAGLTAAGYPVVTTSRDPDSLTGTPHVQLDLVNPDLSFFEQYRFDTIIHLAAISNARMCSEMPDLAQKINVDALASLIETASAHPSLQRYLYPSSVTLVQDGQDNVDENSPVDPNKDLYTQTKYEAEQLLLTATKDGRLPATIFRFPNIYGPGQPAGKYATFVPQVIHQALAEKRIEIWNTDTVRDWVFVEDIVDLFLKTLNATTRGLYQIGSGVGTSTGEIAQWIADIAQVPLTNLRKPGTGPKHVITNPQKITADTGWAARTPIGDGLKKTFLYYQSHPQP